MGSQIWCLSSVIMVLLEAGGVGLNPGLLEDQRKIRTRNVRSGLTWLKAGIFKLRCMRK